VLAAFTRLELRHGREYFAWPRLWPSQGGRHAVSEFHHPHPRRLTDVRQFPRSPRRLQRSHSGSHGSHQATFRPHRSVKHRQLADNDGNRNRPSTWPNTYYRRSEALPAPPSQGGVLSLPAPSLQEGARGRSKGAKRPGLPGPRWDHETRVLLSVRFHSTASRPVCPFRAIPLPSHDRVRVLDASP